MIDKRVIEQVLAEQYQELQELKEIRLCKRKEEDLVEIDSTMAQVVIGVRRCGKSTLCYNVLKWHSKEFAYANFDDERFEKMVASDLNDVLETLYKIYGDFKYLFLDEIQNVEGWHLFVNRLLRQRMHLLITGSNAKMLSGELATHLTGRHDQIELFPFSFAEYCDAKDVDVKSPTTKAEAFRRAAFDEYLKQGGFPELLVKKNKTRYINNLVESILKRDIEQRYKIRYKAAFEQLAHHLLDIAPALTLEEDLAKMVGIKSHHTVRNYINYLEEAYLLLGLHRYSQKSRKRLMDEKIYPVDVAFMDGRIDAFAGENLGWRLETLVYVELLRRNHPISKDVYYYKNDRGYEADFVVCRNNKVEEVYQVSYDISKNETRKREIRGLMVASKETKCDNLYLITDFHREEVMVDGKLVKIIPAYEWMLK